MTHHARELSNRRGVRGVILFPALFLAIGVACRSPGPKGTTATQPAAASLTAAQAIGGDSAPPSPSPSPSPSSSSSDVSGPTGVIGADGGADGDARPSSAEDREADVAADTVTVKLLAEPAQKAHVFWGVKDFGLAPLEIKRPRGSGPLDLTVRATGYLTVHIRAFTDRDDKIALRLVPEGDAPRMFGYRPPMSRP